MGLISLRELHEELRLSRVQFLMQIEDGTRVVWYAQDRYDCHIATDPR